MQQRLARALPSSCEVNHEQNVCASGASAVGNESGQGVTTEIEPTTCSLGSCRYNAELGTRVVVEACGVVEAGSLDRDLTEETHAIRAIEEPPRRAEPAEEAVCSEGPNDTSSVRIRASNWGIPIHRLRC